MIVIIDDVFTQMPFGKFSAPQLIGDKGTNEEFLTFWEENGFDKESVEVSMGDATPTEYKNQLLQTLTGKKFELRDKPLGYATRYDVVVVARHPQYTRQQTKWYFLRVY